ncbi:hypothetical protein Hamer_G012307, partial [Homarus americanus]
MIVTVYFAFVMHVLWTVFGTDRYWGYLSSDIVIEPSHNEKPEDNGGTDQRTRDNREPETHVQSYNTSDQHKDMSRARQERDVHDTESLVSFQPSRSPFSPITTSYSIDTGVCPTDDVALIVGQKVMDGMLGRNVLEYIQFFSVHITYYQTLTSLCCPKLCGKKCSTKKSPYLKIASTFSMVVVSFIEVHGRLVKPKFGKATIVFDGNRSGPTIKDGIKSRRGKGEADPTVDSPVYNSQTEDIHFKLYFRPEPNLQSKKPTKCWNIGQLQQSFDNNETTPYIHQETTPSDEQAGTMRAVWWSLVLVLTVSSSFSHAQEDDGDDGESTQMGNNSSHPAFVASHSTTERERER